MELSYPLPFLKQDIPSLDPPMPFSFGLSFWDYKSIDKSNYIYSVGLVFLILIVSIELLSVFKGKDEDQA